MKLINKIKADPRIESIEWDETMDWEDDNFNTHYGQWCICLKDGYQFDWDGSVAYERNLKNAYQLLKCIKETNN